MITYLLIGMLSSFLGSLVGLGGGFIIVPALSLLLGLDIKNAIFISLIAVFVLSTIQNLKNRDLIQEYRFQMGPLLILTIAGSLLASYLGTKAPDFLLSQIFAVVMIVFGFVFISEWKPSIKPMRAERRELLAKVMLFLTGALGGLLGIGGGSIAVPVLNKLQKVEMRVATRLSFLFVFASSASALVMQFQQRKEEIQQIPLDMVALLLLGTAVGFLIALRMKLSNKAIQYLFAGVVILIGGIKLLLSFPS